MKSRKERSRSPKSKTQMRAIYAKSRRDFTAADLQKFTVVEKGIPLEKIIAEMEKIQRNSKSKSA